MYCKMILAMIIIISIKAQNGLMGYQNYLFGMSEREIRKEVNKFTEIRHNSDSELYSIINTMTYEKGTFFGYPVNRWDFNFYKKQFYSLNVEILVDSASVKSIYQNFISYFTGKYGTAKKTNTNSPYQNNYWYIKKDTKIDDVIELNVWKYEKYSVSISFSNGEILDIVSKKITEKDRKKMQFR